IPGALNVGLGGQFAIWAGSLIAPHVPIIIAAESDAQVDESVMRLARVGLENVRGYLRGGVAAWRASGRELATLPQISVAELKELIETTPALQVLDERRAPEYASGHVPQALSAPLAQLKKILPACISTRRARSPSSARAAIVPAPPPASSHVTTSNTCATSPAA